MAASASSFTGEMSSNGVLPPSVGAERCSTICWFRSASSKRVTVLTLSGLLPLTDAWRLLGGLYLDPPLGGLGSNQPAVGGLTLTVIRSWS